MRPFLAYSAVIQPHTHMFLFRFPLITADSRALGTAPWAAQGASQFTCFSHRS